MITSIDICRFLKYSETTASFEIIGVSSKDNLRPRTLSFINQLKESDIDIILQNHNVLFIINKSDTLINASNVIVCDNPRSTYGALVEHFFRLPLEEKIEPSASIDSSVKIGKGCYIGHNVVIEEGVVIGEGTRIDHNTVVRRSSQIGRNCSIGSNVSIGGEGFGYDVDSEGNPFRIPHLGNVVIGNNVDIGSNVSIAKGTIDSTVISDFVKIDDCVFIAHNVYIGKGSFIIAGAEISGSVIIGERVWISPEVTVINKVTIGDDALVGIGATVTKNIEAGMIAVGSPAKAIRKRYG